MRYDFIERLQEQSRKRHEGKDRDQFYVKPIEKKMPKTKIVKKGIDEAFLLKQKKIKEIAAEIESKL